MKTANYKQNDYPQFSPIPEGVARPFWSVMIPTYNSKQDCLTQTLESVLAQDPGLEHMQIEVIDNCSTQSDLESLVAAIGKGRVAFYRQDKNVGPVKNSNTCIARSVGRWIHILHDDDLVLPGFYSKYEDLIERFPDSTLLTGPVDYIDENGCKFGWSDPITTEEGVVRDFLKKMASKCLIQAPSVVIPRTVYENIGGYSEKYYPCDDWEMYFRATAYGQAVSTITPYSYYRIHEDSDMNTSIITGNAIKQALLTLNFCFDRLPVEVQRELNYGKYFDLSDLARLYSEKLRNKYPYGSLVHAVWALKLNPKLGNIKFYLIALLNYYLQTFKEFSPKDLFSRKTINN
ncbi:glycosyltransferase [Pleurocapsa sp. FMAR1]|uniref:glycosyltransferase n=1 Tax=Pleurocapsa sp. FMAR1 TaxID=3040204 RepID=UPI0029C6E9A7|nr:glycosyltransferase [Pleurocapsa sp. FMAR1]